MEGSYRKREKTAREPIRWLLGKGRLSGYAVVLLVRAVLRGLDLDAGLLTVSRDEAAHAGPTWCFLPPLPAFFGAAALAFAPCLAPTSVFLPLGATFFWLAVFFEDRSPVRRVRHVPQRRRVCRWCWFLRSSLCVSILFGACFAQND